MSCRTIFLGEVAEYKGYGYISGINGYFSAMIAYTDGNPRQCHFIKAQKNAAAQIFDRLLPRDSALRKILRQRACNSLSVLDAELPTAIGQACEWGGQQTIMALRDPYRALAKQLLDALETCGAKSKPVALPLTREEWALVIEALHRTAAPYASRTRATRKSPPLRGTAQSDGGTDATG